MAKPVRTERKQAMAVLGGTSMRRVLAVPALALVIFVLLIPLGKILVVSFTEPSATATAPHLPFGNYLQFTSDWYYGSIAVRTLWMAIVATVISALLAFPFGVCLWQLRARLKLFVTLISLSPMLVSIVVRAYGWIVILGDTGVINRMLLTAGIIDAPMQMMYTDGAMLLGFVYVEFPFMVLAILTSLERIPREVVEAARTLGASPLRTITNVVLPLARPGVIAGATIVFSLCMTAFVTPLLMGGSGAKVLTTLIYQQFVVSFNWPLGAVAAVILLILSLGVVAIFTFAVTRSSGRPARS